MRSDKYNLPGIVEVEMTEAAIMSGTACDEDNCPLAILLGIRFPGKCVRVNNSVFIHESEADLDVMGWSTARGPISPGCLGMDS
ncbi:MAG: hypothetical protein OXH70_17480 [Acidobacteria bacterium]|nr:hypothetical protein [Acidobacteriota bacterium]